MTLAERVQSVMVWVTLAFAMAVVCWPAIFFLSALVAGFFCPKGCVE